MTARRGLPSPGPGTTWVIDLDGVIWLTGTPIAGGGDAIARLQHAGTRVLFATNNSSPTLGELVGRLERAGIHAGRDDLVTSGQAVATMVEPGATVLVLADAGVQEALIARGATVVASGPADAVVVGWTRDFDFDRLAAAADAVRAGARLLGTNDDATLPTSEGLLPGSGSLLAAVTTASGAVPELAGKPHATMAQLVTSRAGPATVVVGDRLSTDGLLARRLGARFGLVLSGVTPPDGVEGADPAPDQVAGDLGALVAAAMAGNSQPAR